MSQRGGAREIRQSRAADADPRPVKRLSSSRRVLAALRRVDDDRRFRWVLTARGARVPPVSAAARLRRVGDDRHEQTTLNGANASVSPDLAAARLRRRVSRQTITDGIVILTRALS